MDIEQEINSYLHIRENYKQLIEKNFGTDAFKNIQDIFDILQRDIDGHKPSLAFAKLILHICEDLMEKATVAFATGKD